MPAQLIPPHEFSVITHPFRYSAFRLEARQDYGGSGEDAELAAFLAGRPRPPRPEHDRWAEVIRGHVHAGRILQRVHVVTEPLTDYTRWELSWGYAPSVEAGEDVRVIPVLAGQPWPRDVPQRDFWLFDASELYDMHYDQGGMWLGVEQVTDPGHPVAVVHQPSSPARPAPRNGSTPGVQWVTAAGQSPQVEAELVAMLAATRFGYSNNRDMVHDGLAAAQAYIAVLEAETTWIAEFQPACIPGLVQTAAYARELLVLHGGPMTAGASEAEVEAQVAERIRRQEILYHPGKRIQIVIGETALHDPPGSTETLVGQLDRLVAIAGLSTVDLAVLPIGTPMPILPLGSFVTHDGQRVFVETMTGEQRIEDPAQVTVYVTAFDLLREAAATGPDAVTLIRRVMHELARCP